MNRQRIGCGWMLVTFEDVAVISPHVIALRAFNFVRGAQLRTTFREIGKENLPRLTIRTRKQDVPFTGDESAHWASKRAEAFYTAQRASSIADHENPRKCLKSKQSTRRPLESIHTFHPPSQQNPARDLNSRWHGSCQRVSLNASQRWRLFMESRVKAMGHPIHQMLIPFPLGLLGTAVIFD